METLSFTSLSSKGQIVIPQDIRESLRLLAGEKFAVTGHGDTIILKKMSVPSINGLDDILKRTRTLAKDSGVTKKDVSRAVARTRKSSSRS